MTDCKKKYAKLIVVGSCCRRLAGRICKQKGRPAQLLLLLLLSFVFVSQSFAAEPLLQVRTTTPGALVTIEREISDTKILLSVSDAENKPLFDLKKEDFIVTALGRTAKILAIQPQEESLGVPRNIVLVLDNSDSMRQRHAVESLLAGVDELLKIVRPIDQVQVVVFTRKTKMTIGGRDLHVQTFKSNNPGELKNFISDIYRDGITSTTVLYEAMLAGVEIIRAMPANEPRFLVVFSDGEDINSDFSKKDVIMAVDGLEHYKAYAIDYMPGASTNEFLKTFSERNHGQIWKATSETNLVEIFQSVASRMQYYYELSYLFPLTGNLAVSPADLTINELASIDPASQTEGAESTTPAKIISVINRVDNSVLTLRPVVDTAYNFAQWKVTVANTNGTLFEKEGEGVPPTEISFPLETGSLAKFAAGGDISVLMEVHDSKDQKITLAAPPVKINYLKSTGSLSVSPSRLNINEIAVLDASRQESGVPTQNASFISRIDSSVLTLHPIVDMAYSFVRWSVRVTNADGTLIEKNGEGTPPSEIEVPLKTDALGKLAAGGDITVVMEIYDATEQRLVLTAPTVKVNYFKTTGSLSVSPTNLTIEEVKTIDSSPLLGHIYFPEGSSNLPAQYVTLSDREEITDFDEQRFRDTLEKYYQVLNIIGKRLIDHPSAAITLTGCNDNMGPEKQNKKLSKARAETVRDYFQANWRIDPNRIKIEARNLPEVPSTNRIEEGQAENRRVEISSDDMAILAPIRSTYLSVRIDSEALTLRPVVNAAHGISHWSVRAVNSNGNIGELTGQGSPPAELSIPLEARNLTELAEGGDITLTMAVEDNNGQKIVLSAGPVKVTFIKTSQRLAQKQDLKVQEKYALILFNFDSDAISGRNQEIVNAIVARMKELPRVMAEITGHTDNIGKEDYNLKLSQRRALSVYKLLPDAYGNGLDDQQIHYGGVGPNESLFDNMSPETRAFNRTVTITLEYMVEN